MDTSKGFEKGIAKLEPTVVVGQYRILLRNKGTIVIEHKKNLERSRSKIRQAQEMF
jgi:hypothetical protein